MDFKKLKKTSGNLEQLSHALEKLNTNNNGSDNEENFWRPALDKAGNGYAVIRFLPAPPQDGEDGLPWVKIFDHGFQGPGGWYIEKCLTTKDGKCPVCEHNSRLWDTGVEANKEIVRKQKRRLSYYANVLIVEDSKNPDAVGQVKLFKFGKKIFDKISEAMNPQFEDEKPFNPFDLWKGANFKLKIRKVEGYSNYDKSEFDSISAISEDDDELEKIWKSEHSLKNLVKDSEFKSYEELDGRLKKVLGSTVDGSKPTTVEKAKMAPKKAEEDTEEAPWSTSTVVDDEDDILAQLSKLAD